MNTKFVTTSFPVVVPLCYDTVYYVESIDNEALNATMRQLQQAGPLFSNAEVLPFPIKLQYLTQKELDGDYLRSQLSGKYDAEEVNEVIENMRACLYADKGSTLSARCLPSFTYYDVMEQDFAVCSCPDFGLLSAHEALENAKSFARFVAEENFQRLTNESYSTYQRLKEDAQYPRRSSYGGSGTMGFIVNLPDPKNITRDMQRRISELDATIKQLTGNDASADELLSAYFMKKLNEGKMKEMYPILIKSDNIFLKISEKENKKVVFDRYGVAKTLYIFFLRLIEYATTNQIDPIYVSRAGLIKYKKDLISIYERISRWSSRDDNSKEDIEYIIDSLCDKNDREFANILSSIRRFFKREFDVDTLEKQFDKCYSIEVMGRDKYNSDVYGIKLTKDDFDLGRYSIEWLRFWAE
ncbi:MAG: hypothetical protein J6T63_03470 [Bacteroidales bacterium]|nr:hypothetical protein [Bacteroidales bacterium]